LGTTSPWHGTFLYLGGVTLSSARALPLQTRRLSSLGQLSSSVCSELSSD
jgi:hypothetical protein